MQSPMSPEWTVSGTYAQASQMMTAVQRLNYGAGGQMSANLSYDPGRAAPARTSRGAIMGTATGAAIAFVLAGTAVPAAAAQTADVCGARSSLGVVTCVYDSPAVTHYALRVPAGVTDVHIEARGAAGGNGGSINSRMLAPQGGRGGFVAADFPVAAGDLMRIVVGGHGQDADGMAPGAGGRHGGAKGGAGTIGGGGGGGASSVRLRGSDPAARILVAGGGGGAGGAMDSPEYWSGRGGAGGGERGADGMGGAGRGKDGRNRDGTGNDGLLRTGIGRDVMGGDDTGKGGVGAVGPTGGAGLKRITGVDGHSGYDADHGGGGGEGGYGTSNSITHSGTLAGGPVGAGGGGGGYAGGAGGAAGATVGGGGGGGSGFVATSMLAPTVARLGSIRLSMGTGPLENGEVVISYQLPTDRHGRSAAVTAPTRAAATSSKRHSNG